MAKERVSYLSMVEYFGSEPKTFHKFFTSKKPVEIGKDCDDTKKLADEWNSAQLREHGTHNVRCTLSKVLFCITG